MYLTFTSFSILLYLLLLSLSLLFETGSHYVAWESFELAFFSSCLRFPSAGITGFCHCVWNVLRLIMVKL